MKKINEINTTGDLRAFLSNALVGVLDGEIDAQKGMTLAKLAGQVNESIYAEIKLQKMQQQLGNAAAEFGRASLDNAPR